MTLHYVCRNSLHYFNKLLSLFLILVIISILHNVCKDDSENDKKNTFNKRNFYKMKKKTNWNHSTDAKFFSLYSVITSLIINSVCSTEATELSFFVFISVSKTRKCSNWNICTVTEASRIFSLSVPIPVWQDRTRR